MVIKLFLVKECVGVLRAPEAHLEFIAFAIPDEVRNSETLPIFKHRAKKILHIIV